MSAALLTNVVFWSGIAIGGVVFAALLEVTGGEWAGALRLTAERFRWFLPVSFLAVAVVMWRSEAIYPWARQAVASPWFKPWFVALRVDAATAVVYAAAFWFCDAAQRSRADGAAPAAREAKRAAVVFLLVYAVGFSLITVDLIMSLEPRWTSTLFPAYVLSGNVYAGIAGLAVLVTWRRRGAVMMPPGRTRDLANILVGTALFWFYLFWSQYLVIWYGNLTAEVGYLMSRLDGERALAWAVLVMCCAVPAFVLVPQWGKRLTAVQIIAPMVLVGLWLERWILIAPDASSRSPIAAAITTAAFAIVFLVSVRSTTRA